MIPRLLCDEYEAVRDKAFRARNDARGDPRHIGLAHTHGLAEGRRLELIQTARILYGYESDESAVEAFEAFAARYKAEAQGVK